MPSVEHNRFVIAVPHPTSHVYRRVAPHHSPSSALPSAVAESAILHLGKPIGIPKGGVNSLPAEPIKFFAHMCLSPPSPQRLVTQNQKPRHSHVRRRHEKPFALSHASMIDAPMKLVRSD